MSSGERLPWEVGREIAEMFRVQLAPFCEQIEIAGSVRRGAETVGDVELVAIPKWVYEPAAQGGLFEAGTEKRNALVNRLRELVGPLKLLVIKPREKEPSHAGRVAEVAF